MLPCFIRHLAPANQSLRHPWNFRKAVPIPLRPEVAYPLAFIFVELLASVVEQPDRATVYHARLCPDVFKERNARPSKILEPFKLSSWPSVDSLNVTEATALILDVRDFQPLQ